MRTGTPTADQDTCGTWPTRLAGLLAALVAAASAVLLAGPAPSASAIGYSGDEDVPWDFQVYSSNPLMTVQPGTSGPAAITFSSAPVHLFPMWGPGVPVTGAQQQQLSVSLQVKDERVAGSDWHTVTTSSDVVDFSSQDVSDWRYHSDFSVSVTVEPSTFEVVTPPAGMAYRVRYSLTLADPSGTAKASTEFGATTDREVSCVAPLACSVRADAEFGDDFLYVDFS